MATEYRELNAVIRAIWSVKISPDAEIFNALKRAIEEEVKNIEPANVQPVVHGRWIPMTYIRELTENRWPNCRWEKAIEPDSVDGLMCSECGEIFDFADARNFCTQCGADMRKVVEIDQVKESDT